MRQKALGVLAVERTEPFACAVAVEGDRGGVMHRANRVVTGHPLEGLLAVGLHQRTIRHALVAKEPVEALQLCFCLQRVREALARRDAQPCHHSLDPLMQARIAQLHRLELAHERRRRFRHIGISR